MPRHGMPHGCRCTRTFLGAPPTPRFGVSEARFTNPGRKNAPRERDGLFDIVSWAETRCCPHPEERACASASARSNARARVSKDEDGRLGLPSCFETHRSAVRPWKRLRSRPAAMLLSMRASGVGDMLAKGIHWSFWPNEATSRCGKKNQPAAVGNGHGCDPLFPACYLQ